MVGYYRLKDIGVRLEPGVHIVPAQDFTAVEEANRVLEAAEERASAIVEDARRVYAEEKIRGYDDGRADAQLDAFERLLAEQRTLDTALQGVENDLARLVETCVRKLIHSFDESARAESVVRQALSKMRREKRVELRVPSSLYAFFRASIDTIRTDYPEVELVDVVEDDSLDAEQIVVETSIGRVDGNLGRRLEELNVILRSGQRRSEDKSGQAAQNAPEADDD